jgi:hypothetical protein
MHRDAHKRLLAAHDLILGEMTSREKFNNIRTLILGLNPKIDEHLNTIEKHLSTWDQVEKGDVVMLSAENLPENTEEEKKRKKWLLFLITSWRQLGSEVQRVSAEMANSPQSGAGQTSMWGRIFKGAKGPLGVITVVAVGLVALQQTSVPLTIQNKGCGTLHVGGGMPISIPGFSIPTDPIPSGGSAVATIPPLTFTVDGSQPGSLVLTSLNFSFTFNLPLNITDVTYNGTSLLGENTELRLSEDGERVLALVCS